MTKKELEKQRDDIALSMIEAEGDTYYELQLELEEIEENLYMMKCLGVDNMANAEGFDQVIDSFEDWSEL